MSSDIRRKKASVKRKTPDSEEEGTPSPPRRPRLAPNRRGQHAAGRTLRRSPRIAGKNTMDGTIQRPGTPLAQPDEPEELEATEEPVELGYPGDPGEPEEPGENGEIQGRRGQKLEGQDILLTPGGPDPSSSADGTERANSADHDTAGVSQQTHSPNQFPTRQGSAEADGENAISPKDHAKLSTQESDLFLDILIANVESTQALQMFAAHVEASTKFIGDLHNGRGGVNWVMAQINNLPAAETAENSGRLVQFQQDLNKLWDAIERRSKELHGVRLLMNHASRDQTRRDERLYSFADNMTIGASSALLKLPAKFWTCLSECKKMRAAVQGLQQELSDLAVERAQAEEEIDIAAVKAFRSRASGSEDQNEHADSDRTPFHLRLHRSPRMFQLSRRRDELD
ncbi:hypothetical protein KC345_g1573 [Hortaea werneckii]|nr:hypothetical protein KC345_g1573 [Hortaea werneckii]